MPWAVMPWAVMPWAVLLCLEEGGRVGLVSIARRNLFQDRTRFVITLAGVAAAMLMVFFSLGMLTGVLDESVGIIDRNSAAIWVTQEGAKSILAPSLVPGAAALEIAAMGGVSRVSPLVYCQIFIDRSGRQLPVMVTGYDLASGAGAPWEMAAGEAASLARSGTVVVDRSAGRKLGGVAVGDTLTVAGSAQEVVGVSRGAKWFVAPYLFTSIDNARALVRLGPGWANFLLVEVAPGADLAALVNRIGGMAGVDGLATPAIRRNTRDYMIFQSGMGLGVAIMAAVGFLVALVLVALTTYTATAERVPEFGTLKAIGAPRGYISRIVLEQVFTTVTAGYATAFALYLAVGRSLSDLTLFPIKTTAVELAVTYVLVLGFAALGSLSAIRKVNRVDPAIVFRA